MRRFVVVLTLILLPAAAGAQTVTVRDIVELSKAGLGEAALLALIDVNRPVFPVDTETLKALKTSGVPPDVIIAMIKSGRTPALPTPPAPQPLELPEPPDPTPRVVVVEHHHDEPRVREVAVPVPVYILVRTRSRASRDDDHRLPSRHSASRPMPTATESLSLGLSRLTVADFQKDAKVPMSPQRK